ncbi:ParB/RepB/Spo0J family partition protein [Allostreptomyces psammosilenae]|uniref:ParB-like N-terminal domain-containing protein n=1 Tax=Allostreptomyces psammosilenae TaxID=1892865 RepID=A0A852ZXF8_9ACTN|nr:ParB/RepB/Spo0J family partition protein [Allostreptomyces psammosilenae]NYI06879.1 hypothetical protein [Allostreptomyces psammosilenae]
MPISSLVLTDSPRLDGESAEHVRVLAESDAELPPIIVHRPTMRVIDGTHRLRAAVLRGQDTIAARFFDGTEADAFVLAVRANIEHGLPLSLADRSAAAARVMAFYPQWSDRAIAAVTGLAAKTVGAIRRRTAPEDSPRAQVRIGRDGRVRPLSSARGRTVAGEFVTNNPQASLRQIAEVAGISLGTARDVRERLRRGEDPLPPKLRPAHRPAARPARAAEPGEQPRERPATAPRPAGARPWRGPLRDRNAIVWALRRDPSLRYAETGRTLLRLLDAHLIGPEEWKRLVEGVPPHRADLVLDAARECAAAWQEFAEQLQRRHLSRDAETSR